MKELTQQEIEMVSGAGIIQDTLTNLGSSAGQDLYGLVSHIGIETPGGEKISLGSLFPDLGKTLGGSAGSAIGGKIESTLASLPIVGGWLKGLLGS